MINNVTYFVGDLIYHKSYSDTYLIIDIKMAFFNSSKVKEEVVSIFWIKRHTVWTFAKDRFFDDRYVAEHVLISRPKVNL